jgi:hypothetical protein
MLVAFFTSLLVISGLIIGWFSIYVVYNLYRGQR